MGVSRAQSLSLTPRGLLQRERCGPGGEALLWRGPELLWVGGLLAWCWHLLRECQDRKKTKPHTTHTPDSPAYSLPALPQVQVTSNSLPTPSPEPSPQSWRALWTSTEVLQCEDSARPLRAGTASRKPRHQGSAGRQHVPSHVGGCSFISGRDPGAGQQLSMVVPAGSCQDVS